MTVNTHCLPTGSLGNGEIPVPNVGPANVTISDPGAGNRRGIIVFFHPSLPTPNSFPLAIPNAIGINIQTFASAVVSNGWVFVYPATPEDFYGPSYPLAGVANDVNLDPLNGTRNINCILHWWDHLVEYLASLYGANRPTATFGFSFGAHKSLVVAANRTSTIIGAGAHAIPTLWENLASDPPVVYSSINWSNYDLGTTYLNSTNIPTILGYSTTDGIVGYNSSSTPVSNVDQIITNAQNAGQNCTRYSSASDEGVSYPDGHLFLTTDASQYASWVSSTLDPLAPANAF